MAVAAFRCLMLRCTPGGWSRRPRSADGCNRCGPAFSSFFGAGAGLVSQGFCDCSAGNDNAVGAQFERDPGGKTISGSSHGFDLGHHLCCRGSRVMVARWIFLVIAVHRICDTGLFMWGRIDGRYLFRRRRGDRTNLAPLDQAASSVDSEWGITVFRRVGPLSTTSEFWFWPTFRDDSPRAACRSGRTGRRREMIVLVFCELM